MVRKTAAQTKIEQLRDSLALTARLADEMARSGDDDGTELRPAIRRSLRAVATNAETHGRYITKVINDLQATTEDANGGTATDTGETTA